MVIFYTDLKSQKKELAKKGTPSPTQFKVYKILNRRICFYIIKDRWVIFWGWEIAEKW